MSDKELNQDVAKVKSAEDQVRRAEHSGSKDALEQASLALHGEMFAVDLKASDRHDPAYRKQFMEALTRADQAEGHVPLVTIVNGKLTENERQMEQADITRIKAGGGPEADTVRAIEAQRALMAGGDNSLFNKLIQFNHPGEDPNKKESMILPEDIDNYLAKGNPTAQERTALNAIKADWENVSAKLGDTYIPGPGNFISKFSMGVNLTRKFAHTLVDGGENSIFNQIARSHYEDPATYRLSSGDLDAYIAAHKNDLSKAQIENLSAIDWRTANLPGTDDRHAGGRDWALGMVGEVDGNGMHFTRDSLTNGITKYGLDKYTVERTKDLFERFGF